MVSLPDLGSSVSADVLALAPTLPGGHAREVAMNSMWERISGTTQPKITVDRYELASLLGTGGMGSVYRAWDDQLDRAVALKLLTDDDADTRALADEARAAASVRHPNVVEVYDIGTFRGGMFIAMELVPGPSLAKWIRDAAPPVAQVINACVQAGHGLAAAHRAGIVHCDFKAANVVVELDADGVPGRARVVDFGLARPLVRPDESGVGRTRAGGTPLYVAPEQIAEGRCDPKADQFSFCVSAWECVFGEHPFAAPSLAEVLTRARTGPRPLPPKRAGVPVRFGRALRRGLAIDPAERFASMDALLRALASSRSRVPLVGVALIGGLALVVAAARDRRPPHVCDDPSTPVAVVWNPAARDGVHAAFSATGVASAERAFTAVAADLDAFGDEWTASLQQVCAERTVDEAATFDRKRGCLAAQLDRVEAWVQQLSTADAKLVEGPAARGIPLPTPANCLDGNHLDVRLFLDPTTTDPNERAIAAEAEMAWVATEAGRFEDALIAARHARELATAVGHRKGEAVALLLEAKAQAETDPAATGALARDAYHLATASDLPYVETAAALAVANIEIDAVGNLDEATHWLRLAESGLARLPNDTLSPELAYVRARINLVGGNLDEAVTDLGEAIAAAEFSKGQRSGYAAKMLNMRAIAYVRQGRLAEARADFERTAELIAESAGKSHPFYAALRGNIAGIDFQTGRFAEALAEWEAIEPIMAEAFGTDSPNMADLLRNIGMAKLALGDHAGALAALERSLVLTRGFGPDHPKLGHLLVDVALARAKTGDPERALEESAEAIEIAGRSLGPTSIEYAVALFYRTEILDQVDRHEEAREGRRRALEIMEAAVGSEHPRLEPMLAGVARDLLAAHEIDEAVALFERAVVLAEGRYGETSKDATELRAELEAARRQR